MSSDSKNKSQNGKNEIDQQIMRQYPFLNDNHTKEITQGRRQKYDHKSLDQLNLFKEKMLKKHGPKINFLHDNIYGRFIEGWVGDLTMAESKFDTMIDWTLPREVYTKKPWELKKIWSSGAFTWLARTKQGRVVQMAKARNYLPVNYTAEEMAQFAFCYNNYTAMQCQDHDEYFYVIDCKGFSNENFDQAKFKVIQPLVGGILPSGVYKIFLIRVNFTVKMMYNLIYPFMPERTKPKFVVIGDDVSELREKFSEWVEMKDLPVWLGGDRVDLEDC